MVYSSQFEQSVEIQRASLLWKRSQIGKASSILAITTRQKEEQFDSEACGVQSNS